METIKIDDTVYLAEDGEPALFDSYQEAEDWIFKFGASNFYTIPLIRRYAIQIIYDRTKD